MSIEEHQNKYIPDIWKEYSKQELMMWVSLLSKRATHRSKEAKSKAIKDINDAKNYLLMLEIKIESE